MNVSKLTISRFLSDFSWLAGIASWIGIVVWIAGIANNIPIVCLIGAVGTSICIAIQIVADEISTKLDGWGRGIIGSIILVIAIVLSVAGVYGAIKNDNEITTAAIFSIFILSFVPMIMDHYGIGTQKRRDAYYRMKEAQRNAVYRSGSSATYDQVGELFGMPNAKPIPPIEITNSNVPEDDWNKYLQLGKIDVYAGYDHDDNLKVEAKHEETLKDELEDENEEQQEKLDDKLDEEHDDKNDYTSADDNENK